ncbi:MAG: hypothetical protein K1X86_03325 [Ignavibacteria bacterium]|nr:hypothetical protein [Ignavibacteria bacterium]
MQKKAGLLLLLILFFLPLLLSAQTPELQGLKEFTFLHNGDTVRFYISNYNPDTARAKIFFYLQGSGAYPMVNRTDSIECCFSNYPKKLMKQFPKDYAFVYIQKTGLPYYANIDHFEPGEKFTEKNNVIERAEIASEVVNYIFRNVYPQAKIFAVLGHSEGSDVCAKLAAINNKITHLCFSSGNGTPQIFNDVIFIRRQMFEGKISSEEAQKKIEELYAGFDNVYYDTSSTVKYFNGDTYKWNYAINQPAIDNLLKLEIPVFLTIGSNDNKVPVEGSDYIKAEFIRHRKTNLTYKVYLNCDHNYVEKLSNGETKDRWFELFNDFVQFIETENKNLK